MKDRILIVINIRRKHTIYYKHYFSSIHFNVDHFLKYFQTKISNIKKIMLYL